MLVSISDRASIPFTRHALRLPAQRLFHRAFTLVEVLIVVVILGILAAIVVPQFTSATTDARRNATFDQLLKIRRALDVYYVRHNNRFPEVTQGMGTWGQISLPGNTYLREIPLNQWVGGANAGLIVFGTAPDTAFTSSYGWIFNVTNGQVWAAGHDDEDHPFPKP